MNPTLEEVKEWVEELIPFEDVPKLLFKTEHWFVKGNRKYVITQMPGVLRGVETVYFVMIVDTIRHCYFEVPPNKQHPRNINRNYYPVQNLHLFSLLHILL